MDLKFLLEIKKILNFGKNSYNKIGKIDILLDDGGHTDLQQTQTLISSINKIKENGIIAIEDVHTSYLTEFGNPRLALL